MTEDQLDNFLGIPELREQLARERRLEATGATITIPAKEFIHKALGGGAELVREGPIVGRGTDPGITGFDIFIDQLARSHVPPKDHDKGMILGATVEGPNVRLHFLDDDAAVWCRLRYL
ncbi:MAG TPA: hypothetical protein VGW40_02810 [Allosphingosinicella sp.]|nr:hypothetical protein [Allosphingosinicella sp.]